MGYMKLNRKNDRDFSNKIFIKIDPQKNHLRISKKLSYALDNFDYVDLYIDKTLKKIRIEGSIDGLYKITREKSNTTICCKNLLKDEDCKFDRILDVSYTKSSIEFNYAK